MTKTSFRALGAPGLLLFLSQGLGAARHQRRQNEHDQAKKLDEQYPMQGYIALLLPLFVEGQQTGEFVAGDPNDLLAWYFSVLSGLMVINAHGDVGYRMPE